MAKDRIEKMSEMSLGRPDYSRIYACCGPKDSPLATPHYLILTPFEAQRVPPVIKCPHDGATADIDHSWGSYHINQYKIDHPEACLPLGEIPYDDRVSIIGWSEGEIAAIATAAASGNLGLLD